MVDGRRARTSLVRAGVATAVALLLPLLAHVVERESASAAVPAGFTESVAFSGLVSPTAMEFAPDGRVFVAEKRGTIQMYNGLGDTTPTQVADLRTEVYNFWDRGLLGLEVDPAFPTRPYLYVAYSFDGPIGGTAPRWGTPGADSDPCPNPPGATSDGCVTSGKLARLALAGATTTKTDLVHDWCEQYPSHSVGDVVFGADGALYASGGDGASFEFVDYGQDGSPVNPCGDPGAVGGAMSPPGAEGGALRSQDLRTGADPTGLSGTVIRVSPDTGAAMPDNPAAGAADPNTRRIIASGLRNPFRMTDRPGTNELWLGDVGWNSWEEINRIPNPTGAVPNFGWPCYEGDDRQAGYDAANLKICEDLYTQGTADTKPYFRYRHGQALNASDNCNVTRGSSVAGISFEFYAGGPYPAEYDGALFIADYSRSCIWVMTKGTDGLPDRLKVKPFVSGASGPVDLELSPAGELHYVDLNGGTVRRITYGGTMPTTCPAGQYKAEYFGNKTLTGAPASIVCEAAPLDHDWGGGAPAGVGPDNFSARWTGSFDFASAGTYTFSATSDDGIRVWVDGTLLIDQWRDQAATTFTASRSLSAGTHDVKVEWYEAGWAAVAKVSWVAGAPNAPPQPQISTPAAGTTWQVGETISFSGSATDPEQGQLPASALRWEMVLQHCPSECHAHPMQTWTGVASASVAAPDHEHPSHLELRLTATDANGATATVSRRLDPKTASVTLASEPTGMKLVIGSQEVTAPSTRTVILGSTSSISAPSPQTLAGTSHTFTGWSDGGGQTHTIVATSPAATYTATYAPASTPVTCGGQYRAEYFANRTLSGAPATTACEPAPLDRRWGSGGPAGVGHNNFSARWTGTFDFAGTTTFTGQSDDGMRVWVDGALVIDRWGGAGTSTVTRPLTAGRHEVRVEYFEKTGSAHVKLTW